MKLLHIELWAVITLLSCTPEIQSEARLHRTLELEIDELGSKSVDPDESLITDINVFTFSEQGLCESKLYVAQLSVERNKVDLQFVIKRHYRIFAIVNAGYELPEMTLEDLLHFRLHLAYPDSYSKGIPMSGQCEYYAAGEDNPHIRLTRLMSKLSIRIDRSGLDKDVDFSVGSVKVGNCPSCVTVFGDSYAESSADLFNNGFCKDGAQALPLGKRDSYGLSDEISVYLLENKRPQLDKNLCSYIEISIDYNSDSYYSEGSNGLIYRFFIRENNAFQIERNCHYHVTVRPERSGLLSEDSWRVDKSSLVARDADPYIEIVPGGTTIEGIYYSGFHTACVGDTLHFGIKKYPP